MEETQLLHQPSADFMDNQEDITEKMRKILLGWLVEVHYKFKQNPETLFLAVNFIDRYTEKVAVQRNYYQLVGIACLLIASKYEEIYPPEGKDLIYITDNTYSWEELIAMERSVLSTLNFDFTFPTTYRILERYSKLSESDDLIFYFSRYLIELTLMELKMYRKKPTLVAAASIYLAKRIMKRKNPWSQFMSD
mmetsp:Transcript_7232/g.6346  ORF Transcript_7232/g.6346 Transcript_7232/m.6346 type:complete len:193 (-) Transcript_7232:257-835(-)